MKRYIILAVLLLALCITSGCKGGKNLNSAPVSGSAVSDSTEPDGKTDNVTSERSDDIAQDTQSDTSSAPKDTTPSSKTSTPSGNESVVSGGLNSSAGTTDGSNTQKPNNQGTSSGDGTGKTDNTATPCKHTKEKTELKSPTCTAEGYYKHICEQCGNIRIEKLPAKHIYIEYICSECGAADKENSIAAVNSWIKQNGKAKDEDSPYVYTITSQDGSYTLSSFKNELTLSFLSTAEAAPQEKIDIIIYNTDKCNVTYYIDEVTSSANLKKNSIFNLNSSEWDGFALPAGADKAKYKASLQTRMQKTLEFFETDFLEKTLKLELGDLGVEAAVKSESTEKAN